MSIVEHGRQLVTIVREWIVGPPLVEDEPPKSEPVKRLIAASYSLATSLHPFDELGLVSEDHRLIFVERLGIHLANKLWDIEQSREQNFLDRLARTPFDEIVHYTRSNLPIPTDGSLEETGFLRAVDQAAKDTVTLLDKRGIKVKLESVLYRFVSQQQVPKDVRSVLSYFTVTDGLIQELHTMYKEGKHPANIERFKPEAGSPSTQPLTPYS